MSSSTSCENIIYQSGDTRLNFNLQDCDGEPFDISTATDIWVLFQTEEDPPVILKLSEDDVEVTNGGAGKFSCLMSKTNALLLKSGKISCEVRITIGGEVTVVEIENQLTVSASLFPDY